MRRLFSVVEHAQQEGRSQADPGISEEEPIAGQGVFLFMINCMPLSS